MAFALENLFVDVFAPQAGDIVTILYDIPHGEIHDTEAWRDRREMAKEWHEQIEGFSDKHGLLVKPITTYFATGSQNADMPEHGVCAGEKIRLEDIIRDSTILLSMTQYSATAPLISFTRQYQHLRVASMPGVSRFMEDTGLSADYKQVSEVCARLAPLFESADGIEVTFSTGHTCTFDISDHKTVFQDNGLLHPNALKDISRLTNLPAGEVFTCPNEAEDSRTAGEIPADFSGEQMVFIVQKNQILDVQGDGPIAEDLRVHFSAEAAMRNIAEVAIGCNDKAVVTGNTLQDEKAGFHWAFGRSDHFGGRVGVKEFSSPKKVVHHDIVYAKGNPIVCSRLDFLFPDGTSKTAIRDGVLLV